MDNRLLGKRVAGAAPRRAARRAANQSAGVCCRGLPSQGPTSAWRPTKGPALRAQGRPRCLPLWLRPEGHARFASPGLRTPPTAFAHGPPARAWRALHARGACQARYGSGSSLAASTALRACPLEHGPPCARSQCRASLDPEDHGVQPKARSAEPGHCALQAPLGRAAKAMPFGDFDALAFGIAQRLRRQIHTRESRCGCRGKARSSPALACLAPEGRAAGQRPLRGLAVPSDRSRLRAGSLRTMLPPTAFADPKLRITLVKMPRAGQALESAGPKALR